MDRIIFPGLRRAIALALLFPCGPALADAIDGNWCFKGRHLAIDGPTILTPGGQTITGKYDRHAFVYMAPAGEAEAGTDVFMALLNEETMEFRAGGENAPAQIWRRCTAPSS
jgi:hypothetical protein